MDGIIVIPRFVVSNNRQSPPSATIAPSHPAILLQDSLACDLLILRFGIREGSIWNLLKMIQLLPRTSADWTGAEQAVRLRAFSGMHPIPRC